MLLASAPVLSLTSRLVNGVLAIKPLADLMKRRARAIMIRRAESVGVHWTQEVQALRARDWTEDFVQVQNPKLTYPEYYLRPFHAYEQGNLCWDAAFEVEVAAYAAHARVWSEASAQGDTRLRQSFNEFLKAHLSQPPQRILDLGCSVGMSTMALQEAFGQAQVIGLDLSAYYLAVAHYRAQVRGIVLKWLHSTAETTGLPDGSMDLVTACLLCHELPQQATLAILQEAHRLLAPGGHFALMDMNPRSEVYAKMPPYVLTLLKSTEPYLDEYFSLDLEQAIVQAGFALPTVTKLSPRHRAVVAQVR
ncbi:class I SAM-dependent methyltransferase [Anthocerotibacter panamensis]|uniref:class I SAM-dependent methyltransferase n=1 Tax=Anthocerotibacter panamensis TaxID=2857077 RepID=UPI001C40523F|nr:class I SAM-dependent methyltransferase [Anthocerotibacter panamensis]